MSPNNSVSWNKIIVLASSFGIPLFSVATWLIISGTRLVVKVEDISKHQGQTDQRLDKFDGRLDGISVKIDTIALRQHDAQYIYEPRQTRERPYKESLYNQRVVNGKIIWIAR